MRNVLNPLMRRATAVILAMSVSAMAHGSEQRTMVVHHPMGTRVNRHALVDPKSSPTKLADLPTDPNASPVDTVLAQQQAAYALFVQSHPPDAYAYGTHVRQAWSSWWRASPTHQTWGQRLGDGTLLVAWSVSTMTHSAYEIAVGRLTETLAHGRLTPEDAWEARTATQQARAWRLGPWYRFEVAGPLHDLWINNAPTDVSPVRQFERRYIYTSAYALMGLTNVTARGWTALQERVFQTP